MGEVRTKPEIDLFLKTFLRETDIVARWGGEEFIMLFEVNNLNEAVQLAEKLRKKNRTNHFWDNRASHL